MRHFDELNGVANLPSLMQSNAATVKSIRTVLDPTSLQKSPKELDAAVDLHII